MRKRIFAIILTVCMLIGLLPMEAVAIADKEEITVAVTGEEMVGEKLKADLSELPDASKAVIQWQKKDSGEKDSKAKDVGEGEKTLELKDKDIGKVFRIVVKEKKDSQKSYTSKWTKEVEAGEKKETETKEAETKVPETEKEEEKKPESKDMKEKEAGTKKAEANGTETTGAETKKTDAEKPESKDTGTKIPETEKAGVKNPDVKGAETKASGTEKADAKNPESKDTEAKTPEPEKTGVKNPEPKNTDEKVQESEKTDAKNPEIKDSEEKTPETEKAETKKPEAKDTGAKTPKADGPETEYPQADVPKAEENGTPDVPTPEAPALRSDRTSVEFASVTEGYQAVPEAQTVTITNSGTETVNLTQPAAKDFTIGNLSEPALGAGKTAVFTIQPKAGLAPAVYQEVIVVTGDNGEKLEITVKFAVNAAPVYSYTIGVSQTSLDFGSATLGDAVPAVQTVEITNTGNDTVKLLQPTAVNFEIGTLSASELAPGAKAGFTVRPKAGLASGSYEDTIEVKTGQGTSQTVKAVFTVTGTKLLSIVKPEKITKKNGQDKNAKALGLPAKVSIRTTDGTKKAEVTWRVKAADYSKYTTEKQTFRVNGKITLPNGVYNPDKISLTTTIAVTVKAYVPKIPDVSANKINGVEEGKTYSANTDITFQAVGGGMENQKPKKGDVRYRPVSWTVSDTAYFSIDDFRGTFKLANAGDYTLKVTYNRQIYDGANWGDSGAADTKSVSFRIGAAAPGTTVTGKVAAQTGDDSPILPLVVVCVVCVLCIGGIIFSKKKKG